MAQRGRARGRTGRSCEGLLLCGGAGRRIGGRDKGLLPFAGRTAADALLEVLAQHCDRVFISANRHLERYAAMGCAGVIRDGREGFAGPLAGLEAARPLLQAERILLLPCDAVGLDGDLPRRLLERLDARPGCDLVFACAGGRDHYLIAALHRRALCSVTEQLEGGRGRVREWVEGLACERLRLEGRDGALLRNRNTLDDWGLAAHFPTEPPPEETPRPSPRGR